MDSKEIAKLLPHAFPFLLVDRVLEVEPGVRILSQKNVSINEWFFQGHFPGQPIMPGVLVLEAMAQTSAILAKMSPDHIRATGNIFLVGANNAKWKRQVIPGDVLIIEMIFQKKKGPLWVMAGTAKVDGQLAAMATLSACEVD